MDLLAYQRAFMRMSFAAEPASEDLSALGSSEAALLYRHMIRTRLVGMAKVAFRASAEAAGEQVFLHAFARYLACSPPHSPLIRDVIADFGPFARGDAQLMRCAPAFLADLLRFEESKWRLAYALLSPGEQAGLCELNFEGAPVWNPLLRTLSLQYPVHTLFGTLLEPSPPSEKGALSPEACELLMYRPPGSDEVRWYKAEPFFAALLTRSRVQTADSLAQLVPAVAEQRAVCVDHALLESLATSLTLALERGVLLGVRERA